ncbi:MAG: CPBP family intramembrane glutamic endopeptidase [Spirochaetota bacterium]
MKPFQWRGIVQYLTLNRVDRRGLLYVLPLFSVLFAITAASLKWQGLSPTIPSFNPAEASGPMTSILAPAILVATLLAEEGYFRVLLMKKLAPLGTVDWIAAGVLFGIYHWYALPLPFLITTPLPFGLLAAFIFKQRQNIYPVILLHALAIVTGNVAAVMVLS